MSSTCRRVTVVCLVNCVLCIVISRTASPGAKITTKMNSTGYVHRDRRVEFDIMTQFLRNAAFSIGHAVGSDTPI